MDKAKVLITGSNGQLGQELKALSVNYPELDFIFTDVAELNITDLKAIECFVEQNKPDFIVNCAAYTAVDKAEENRDAAFLLNAVAVDFLVDAAHKCNATLIHISTDYVFDGEHNKPYCPDAGTFPQSVYGVTKNEGEKLILYSDINALIIRTSWLYSTFGNNFVKTMIKLGTERDALGVVVDQIGTPTYARDLAKAILDIIPQVDNTKATRELYHYTNEGVCSWYDFAHEIFRQKNIEVKLNPVPSSEFPTPAKRPSYSVLNKSKIREEYNIEIPHWTDSLNAMLNNLKKE